MTNFYIVAGCRPWNRKVYDRHLKGQLPGEWAFASTVEELDSLMDRSESLRFIFFLHWSWRVPREIWSHIECVCFHMAPLPFGRGGSPLQNLILLGHDHTKLNALRMDEALDTGPIYFQEDLCLQGTAEEVYIRASTQACRMIKRIVMTEPLPLPQTGEGSVFARRNPTESRVPELKGLESLFDFIRMLDADGYPRAFLDYRGFRIEFSRVCRYDGRIVADATITEAGDDHS